MNGSVRKAKTKKYYKMTYEQTIERRGSENNKKRENNEKKIVTNNDFK